MFCSKVSLSTDRPRLKFRTLFNNRPKVSLYKLKSQPNHVKVSCMGLVIIIINNFEKWWLNNSNSLTLCGRLAQLTRPLIASQKVPGSIPGLIEG